MDPLTIGSYHPRNYIQHQTGGEKGREGEREEERKREREMVREGGGEGEREGERGMVSSRCTEAKDNEVRSRTSGGLKTS